MTPTEINIAIAEWCGWKREQSLDYTLQSPMWIAGAVVKMWTRPDNAVSIPEDQLPSYTTDLNAMWTAEERLDSDKWDAYVMNLVTVCGMNSKWDSWSTDEDYIILHATARQRAEALLKTLGLWKG